MLGRCLFALLPLVALAQITRVCVPPVYSTARFSWQSAHEEFDRIFEIADYNTQQFRYLVNREFADGDRDEFQFLETFYFPRRGALYQITGASYSDNSTWQCQAHSIPNEPVQDPCFSGNASQVRTAVVGGLLTVDGFNWQQSNGASTTNYFAQLTPAGVPVLVSWWNNRAGGNDVDTFLNFNHTIPANAFQVPSICPPPTAVLTHEQVRRQPVLGRVLFGEPEAPRAVPPARKPAPAAAAPAPVQQQSICLPNVYAIERRAWQSQYSTYHTTREFFDYNQKKARFTDQAFYFPNPQGPAQAEYTDVLIDNTKNLIWVVTQQGNDPQTRNCTVRSTSIELKPACFTTNGTHQRTVTVGDSLVADVFHANETDSSGIQHLQTILITQQGVPVQVAHTIPGHGFPEAPVPTNHWVEMFENYGSRLPSDAFAVPANCPAPPPTGLPELSVLPFLLNRFRTN